MASSTTIHLQMLRPAASIDSVEGPSASTPSPTPSPTPPGDSRTTATVPTSDPNQYLTPPLTTPDASSPTQSSTSTSANLSVPAATTNPPSQPAPQSNAPPTQTFLHCTWKYLERGITVQNCLLTLALSTLAIISLRYQVHSTAYAKWTAEKEFREECRATLDYLGELLSPQCKAALEKGYLRPPPVKRGEHESPAGSQQWRAVTTATLIHILDFVERSARLLSSGSFWLWKAMLRSCLCLMVVKATGLILSCRRLTAGDGGVVSDLPVLTLSLGILLLGCQYAALLLIRRFPPVVKGFTFWLIIVA